MRELSGELGPSKPLMVVCPSCMRAEAQRAVARFVDEGGCALLLPVLPEFDDEGNPAAVLQQFAGMSRFREVEHPDRDIRVEGTENVFMLDRIYTADLPEDARPIAWDDRSGSTVGAEMVRGKGKLLWLGASLSQYNLFSQAQMFESLTLRMNGRETVESSNRNVFTALWRDGERELLFVMNAHSGKQRTHIRVRRQEGWDDLGELSLAPMEIRSLSLKNIG